MLPTLALLVGQTFLLLAGAPLLNGWIKLVKARLQNRQGPPLWQPYADLWKYLHKERIHAEHSSWVFGVTPTVVFVSTLVAGLLAPTVFTQAPLGFAGDLLALIGLFSLGRFFLALAGLDTGSAFGGMGSSREMALAALVEPGLLLGLFAVALPTGTTELGSVVAHLVAQPARVFAISQGLAFAALLIVTIAETGRIPVDNPDTHLELTMIHEGMLLEYSGPDLGLLVWATAVRQLIMLGLLANLFLPWGIALTATPLALATALLALGAKLGLLGLVLALIETASAKMRIFAVPELLSAAFGLATLALVAQYLR